jgi:hypothetical protein
MSPVMVRHQCPVCGVRHEVSAVRAQFAYGRQLACSCDCEAERRRRLRASFRHSSGAGVHVQPRELEAGHLAVGLAVS